jgi:hypothetical protein
MLTAHVGLALGAVLWAIVVLMEGGAEKQKTIVLPLTVR